MPDKSFHVDDPRSRTREAIGAGKLDEARVWAELATAEALHRLSKTVGRVFDIPDSGRDVTSIPIDRGRTRRPTEAPDSAEQAA